MQKHAFLIMAHHQLPLLKKLIHQLDDERNDIYIHVDKKTADFDFEELRASAEKSQIYFTDRTSVTWGGYSQIRCELVLLKAAVGRNYAYYHLISGADLPLISQDEFHAFFDRISGQEIVGFECPQIRPEFLPRIRYYHFFQDAVGRKTTLLTYAERALIKLQAALKIDRTKKWKARYHIRAFQKGSNWFDITDDLAKYVVGREDEIRRMYRRTFCADEIFLQTLVENSPFKEKLYYHGFGSYQSTFRFVDWTRGNPYTFRSGDYDAIKNSRCFFARKFDMGVDPEIVERLCGDLKK